MSLRDRLASLLRRLGPTPPPHHDWTGWTPLHEPGISTIEGGRWGRVEVECSRCGEVRRVYHGIRRDDWGLILDCPGDLPEAERIARAAHDREIENRLARWTR